MPSGGGHTSAVRATEVASGARAHSAGQSGADVGKGVAARHDIAQAATVRTAEFAGRGDWSARTRVSAAPGARAC
jgi:hypothetical protein